MLQIKKDYMLHIGVRSSDILFQYTTVHARIPTVTEVKQPLSVLQTAWIMWAFLITALSIGTTIVVYEGSPLYPDIKFLLRLLSKTRFAA